MPYAELTGVGNVVIHEDATDSGAVDLSVLEATMVRLPAPAPVKPKSTPPVVARPTSALSARDMIRSIRARLREVEREIKARKALEQERDQLQRLLVAARQKPAQVRTIRAAG